MDKSVVIDTPDGIAFVQLLARRGALRLEIRGMHRRGRSAYAICKEVYGLKGNRESVLAQLNSMIANIQAMIELNKSVVPVMSNPEVHD